MRFPWAPENDLGLEEQQQRGRRSPFQELVASDRYLCTLPPPSTLARSRQRFSSSELDLSEANCLSETNARPEGTTSIPDFGERAPNNFSKPMILNKVKDDKVHKDKRERKPEPAEIDPWL